jgi:hypothetical protein
MGNKSSSKANLYSEPDTITLPSSPNSALNSSVEIKKETNTTVKRAHSKKKVDKNRVEYVLFLSFWT